MFLFLLNNLEKLDPIITNVCISAIFSDAFFKLTISIFSFLVDTDFANITCLSSLQRSLKIFNDPYSAVEGANVLYTDVWASMGEEDAKEKKEKDFEGFTVDKNLLMQAENDAIVMHCLPAYRSKEITDEVIESKKSRIFDQAENRLHVQQALLACLLS